MITSQPDLERVVDAALHETRYAIDTEFHRERTYYPQVALVQLAFGDQLVLIDPLEVDLRPLKALLEGDGTCIMHAGVQDLEVLDLACGVVPTSIFDTQIAAGFLGVSSGSLSAVLKQFLDITIPKGDRLTDWLRRPLSDDQLTYAASDVAHLLPLTDLLAADLKELGRWDWALDESMLLKGRPRNRRLPDEAILRIKEARSLKGKPYRVATAVAAWRERRAADSNVPVRQVLSDLGIVAVAQRAPRDADQLRGLRGVESRHLRNGAADEILEAVQIGASKEPNNEPPVRSPELPRHLRPVVTLVTTWVAQLARNHRLDPALLATRSDIEGLLKGDDSCRLLSGWRQELVGAPIAHLVAGDAAVAFDGDGGLVLEERSRLPLNLEGD